VSLALFFSHEEAFFSLIFQMCLHWRGRRKWFIATREFHSRILFADVHSIVLLNDGSMFDSPAIPVSSSALVADIHIRHYRGTQVNHLCQRALSPSMKSIISSEGNPSVTAITSRIDTLRVYAMFASTCSKFQLFLNSKLVVQSDSAPEYRLYGAHVNVSSGDVFAVSMYGCPSPSGFIGCFGSLVCTGHAPYTEITLHFVLRHTRCAQGSMTGQGGRVLSIQLVAG
jgi:hypothetical protein